MARQNPSTVCPRRTRSFLHVFRFKDVAILCLALPFLTLSTSRSFVPSQPEALASQARSPARTGSTGTQGGAVSAGRIPATASKQQEELSDESTVLAEDPATIRRLFARAAKPNIAFAKNKTSAYEIVEHHEEEQEQRSASTPESRLRRKMRKMAERHRPEEEEFPDRAAERKRKRFVRKAATQIMNLASVKKWKDEQAAIASADKKALAGPAGLKTLGYKGNDRLKAEAAANVEGAAPQKRSKKRTLKDEVIKRFGEMLRDKEAVRKMTRNNADKGKNVLRLVRRTTKRWARRFERDGDTAAAQGISVYLPTSYPSIMHWAFAMLKIIIRIVLSKFGIKVFADPPKAATTESAAKGGTPKGSKKKDKVAPMPASAVAALEGATFHEDRLEPIAKRTVTVVTNNCIFTEDDIIKTFNDKDAPVPPIIPGSLPSLLKLAQTANLHLVTQFPHSMHADLTAYMESRVVPSKRSVHGEWAVDRPEKLILKALEKAGVFAAGMYNKRKCVFCETTEGRGYIARTISENTDTGALALHVDDSTESVNWLQNVCTNTTVVAIKTDINKGQFSKPKKGAAAIVVNDLADYFEKKD